MLYLRPMQTMKWLSIAAILSLVVSCFLPWVSIASKDIVVTGMNADAMRLGKPGLLHIFLAGLFLVFVLIDKIWSIKTAFFIAAFNIAWAFRNFILFSSCSGGVCPEREAGLYLMIFGSATAMIFLLFIKKPAQSGAGIHTAEPNADTNAEVK